MKYLRQSSDRLHLGETGFGHARHPPCGYAFFEEDDEDWVVLHDHIFAPEGEFSLPQLCFDGPFHGI
jgi:hypothetical protein